MAAGIIGFVAAFLTLPEQGGHSLDREVQEWIGGLRSDGLTSVMELLSGIGSTVAIIFITLGAAAVFGYLDGKPQRRGIFEVATEPQCSSQM